MENGESKNNSNISIYLILIAAAVIAGVIYWHVWDDAPYVSPDSSDYMEIALDLRDGGLDTLHYKATGYPFLVALADSAIEPSRLLYLIQLSLHLVSVLLIAFMLVRLGAQRTLIALFAILSLLPQSVDITAYVLTEALTEFLVVAGAVLLLLGLEKGGGVVKKVLPFISGIAFGLSALVRPTYQTLFIALSGILLLFLIFTRVERKRWRSPLIATFIVPLLIIGGYCTYNSGKFGFFGLTPSFGLHLSTKTERVLERLPDEYSEVREMLIHHRDSLLVDRGSEHTGENYIWRARPELERMTGLDKPALSDYMLGLNLILIKRAPIQYLVDISSAATRFWFPFNTVHSSFHSRTVQLIWSVLHFIVISIFFLVVITLFGLVMLRRLLPREARNRVLPNVGAADVSSPSFVIPLAIIVYTLLVSTMFEGGHQRYRAPIDLLILFISIVGIRCLADLKAALSRQE